MTRLRIDLIEQAISVDPHFARCIMGKNLWLIWIAFIVAVFMYLVVGFSLQGMVLLQPDLIQILGMVFFALSLICAAGALLLRWKGIHEPIQMKTLDPQTIEGSQKYLMFSILAWALTETIAIFGLVMMIISGNFYTGLPYSAASLILLALQMPISE
ncbi:MAG TPA: hypothetical protein PK878_02065 [bacterium]|nr:hypothetical protein [bacterium]